MFRPSTTRKEGGNIRRAWRPHSQVLGMLHDMLVNPWYSADVVNIWKPAQQRLSRNAAERRNCRYERTISESDVRHHASFLFHIRRAGHFLSSKARCAVIGANRGAQTSLRRFKQIIAWLGMLRRSLLLGMRRCPQEQLSSRAHPPKNSCVRTARKRL